jgi:hypothetical protein
LPTVRTRVPCAMTRFRSPARPLWSFAASLGIVALVGAGCGGSSSGARRTADSTSTTLSPAAAAVLNAYRAGWAAFEEAVDEANPTVPALAETMTGVQLNSVKRILVADQLNGIVGRGNIELHPKVSYVQGAQALVLDCAFDSSELVYAKTGKPVPPITPPEKVAVRAQLTEVAGSWKVSDQQTTGGSCPPGY